MLIYPNHPYILFFLNILHLILTTLGFNLCSIVYRFLEILCMCMLSPEHMRRTFANSPP